MVKCMKTHFKAYLAQRQMESILETYFSYYHKLQQCRQSGTLAHKLIEMGINLKLLNLTSGYPRSLVF